MTTATKPKNTGLRYCPRCWADAAGPLDADNQRFTCGSRYWFIVPGVYIEETRCIARTVLADDHPAREAKR